MKSQLFLKLIMAIVTVQLFLDCTNYLLKKADV